MKRRLGYSLLETLISLFLLILAILFLLNLLPGAVVATRATECELTANSLADSALEETRARGFESLTLGTSSLTDTVRDGTTYHGRLTIFAPTDANPQFARGIRVELWWEFGGRRRDFVRQTVVSHVQS
ncbi:hypothetical protein IV102_05225 [bacterium]|nr:hypothetical protein [bacterium]